MITPEVLELMKEFETLRLHLVKLDLAIAQKVSISTKEEAAVWRMALPADCYLAKFRINELERKLP